MSVHPSPPHHTTASDRTEPAAVSGVRNDVAYLVTGITDRAARVSPVSSGVGRTAALYRHVEKGTWFVNLRIAGRVRDHLTAPNPHWHPGLSRELALEVAIDWVTAGVTDLATPEPVVL